MKQIRNSAKAIIKERRVNTKVSCTVWSRGKDGDHIKILPIAISMSMCGVGVEGRDNGVMANNSTLHDQLG